MCGHSAQLAGVSVSDVSELLCSRLLPPTAGQLLTTHCRLLRLLLRSSGGSGGGTRSCAPLARAAHTPPRAAPLLFCVLWRGGAGGAAEGELDSAGRELIKLFIQIRRLSPRSRATHVLLTLANSAIHACTTYTRQQRNTRMYCTYSLTLTGHTFHVMPGKLYSRKFLYFLHLMSTTLSATCYAPRQLCTK